MVILLYVYRNIHFDRMNTIFMFVWHGRALIFSLCSVLSILSYKTQRLLTCLYVCSLTRIEFIFQKHLRQFNLVKNVEYYYLKCTQMVFWKKVYF